MASDLASTTFSVGLLNLVNPETLMETEGFGVGVYDPAGSLVESSGGLGAGLTVEMGMLEGFLLERMWMGVGGLDTEGDLKFLVVTNSYLEQGATYKVDLVLEPRSMFGFDSAVSVLTLDGVVTAFTPNNTTTQTLVSFEF